MKLDKKIMIIIALLGIVAATTIAYPQITPSPSCGSTATLLVTTYCTDLPIMLLVVLISFVIAAIIFLFGAALKNDRIRNFGIGELYEAIASAIIVGLFLYLAYLIVVVIPSFLVGGSVDPLSFSLNAISSVEASAELTLSSQIYVPYFNDIAFINNVLTVWTSSGVSITQPLVTDIGQFVVWFTTLQPDLAIAQFLLDAIYALSVEYYFIQFFAIIAIPGFIAPGVILRAFLPTRSFGGTLIAVGIGFYIVMPTLFAFSYATVCPGSIQNPNQNLQTCSSTSGALPPAVANLPIGQTSQYTGKLTGQNLIGQYLTPFWLMLLFFPALVLALTYSFIATLSNFIGASTSMGGRLRALI